MDNAYFGSVLTTYVPFSFSDNTYPLRRRTRIHENAIAVVPEGRLF